MDDEPFVWTYEAQTGSVSVETDSSNKSEKEEIQFYIISEFMNRTPLECGSGGMISVDILNDFGQVAIKEFTWSANQSVNKYKHEIEILAKHRHENIVNLLGILWDGLDKSRYLGYVMEYVEGGSLHKVIHDQSRNYDLLQIYIWIGQIADGLKFLHDNGIIHRDIKPANILVTDSFHLKLADLGVAKNIDASTTAGAGTFRYMAPEMISGGKSSTASDIYSLAITIWEIFHRKTPYYKLKEAGEYAVGIEVVKGARPPINEGKMDRDVAYLVVKSWKVNPRRRPSINKFIDLVTTKLEYFQNPAKETIVLVGENPPISENNDSILMTMLCEEKFKWVSWRIRLPFYQKTYSQAGLYRSIYFDGEIYLLGTLQLFKLNKDFQWMWLASMQVRRSRACCLEWGGYIWILGGYDSNGRPLNSTERYDPRKNKWKLMPDMIYPRADAAATIWKNNLVICGGWTTDEDSNIITNTVELLGADDNLWFEFTEMPDSRCGHSLVCWEEKLNVMGGYDGDLALNTVWQIDPKLDNDQWKTLPAKKHHSSSFASVVVYNKKIYAVGGLAPISIQLRQVEIFDGNSWKRGPYLPAPSSFTSAIIIPKELCAGLLKKRVKKLGNPTPTVYGADFLVWLFASYAVVVGLAWTIESLYPANTIIPEAYRLFIFFSMDIRMWVWIWVYFPQYRG